MRAISTFSREAGISTFWCRAWSAFRTRVSMSATGSVNLIVLLLLEPPVRSARSIIGGEPAAAFRPFVVSRSSRAGFAVANGQRPAANGGLPRGFRNPWNLPAQRQLPEAQPANAELAQKRARPPAQVAAVVLARRELGFPRVLHSFCCRRQTLAPDFRLTFVVETLLATSFAAIIRNAASRDVASFVSRKPVTSETAFPDASTASAPGCRSPPWSQS